MRFLTSILLNILMIALAATYALIPAKEEEFENHWLPVEDSCNQSAGRQAYRPDPQQVDLNNRTITSWKPSDVSI